NGRSQEGPMDALTLDQVDRQFGVKALHYDQGVVSEQAQVAEPEGAVMVQGPSHQLDLARSQAIDSAAEAIGVARPRIGVDDYLRKAGRSARADRLARL